MRKGHVIVTLGDVHNFIITSDIHVPNKNSQMNYNFQSIREKLELELFLKKPHYFQDKIIMLSLKSCGSIIPQQFKDIMTSVQYILICKINKPIYYISNVCHINLRNIGKKDIINKLRKFVFHFENVVCQQQNVSKLFVH